MKLLGTGVLNWDRTERVSNRYGSVFLLLNEEVGCEERVDLKSIKGHGQLIAKILEVRPSYHVGDLFRGIAPGGAVEGEEVVLGEGTLFYEDEAVGLEPKQERNSDWLDPEKLYRCHHQTVELYFKPMKEKTAVKKKAKTTTKNTVSKKSPKTTKKTAGAR